MSIYSDFVRCEVIVKRCTTDKKILDEVRDIVRRNLDAKPSTAVWWDRYGPGPDCPLSKQNMRVIDFVVLNAAASVKELAAQLGKDESTAYRYVSRADGQLLERGGKATIFLDGSGVVRTSAIVIQKPNVGRK